MSKCTQCPHKIGDSYQRDCCFPDCMGWHILNMPKPMPDHRHHYDFYHDDYDGADGGNGLAGTAESFEDAAKQISEIEAEI